jgi:uncharacterized membrane protein YkvA (DUF1232 family)
MTQHADPPARFERFRQKARVLVQSPGRLQSLTDAATRKLSDLGAGRASGLRDELSIAIALLKAWISGEYREVSSQTVVVLAAAVLYFVVPLDVIPDFIFGLGLVDDIAVVAYVFGQVREEIRAFEQWRARPVNDNQRQRVDG